MSNRFLNLSEPFYLILYHQNQNESLMIKAKRLIASLFCLVLALFSTMAYAENILVNQKWEDELGERSLSSCPTLVKEGNVLLVQSDKVLENLSIAITTEDRRQICLELTNVTVDMEYVIPVDLFQTGGYYITVTQGTNYMIGYFRVD